MHDLGPQTSPNIIFASRINYKKMWNEGCFAEVPGHVAHLSSKNVIFNNG